MEEQRCHAHGKGGCQRLLGPVLSWLWALAQAGSNPQQHVVSFSTPSQKQPLVTPMQTGHVLP